MQRTHPMHFTEVKARLQILLESARLHSASYRDIVLATLSDVQTPHKVVSRFIGTCSSACKSEGWDFCCAAISKAFWWPSCRRAVHQCSRPSSCFVHVAVAVSRQAKLNTDLDVYLLLYDDGQTD